MISASGSARRVGAPSSRQPAAVRHRHPRAGAHRPTFPTLRRLPRPSGSRAMGLPHRHDLPRLLRTELSATRLIDNADYVPILARLERRKTKTFTVSHHGHAATGVRAVPSVVSKDQLTAAEQNNATKFSIISVLSRPPENEPTLLADLKTDFRRIVRLEVAV
jgi:hypothetical protein